MQHKNTKTFTFLDESGLLKSSPGKARSYYGIGILKHPSPTQLIQNLHSIFEGLCASLKRNETRVEFSFKSTTRSSIQYDLAFLDTLMQDNDWEFNCIYFDTNDTNFIAPVPPLGMWESYIQYSKMLIKNNLWREEQTILLADYQRKPKQSRRLFEYIALDIHQVYNALQLESHGILLIQATDMLLGAYLYSLEDKFGDKEGNKTRISQKVTQIKQVVGKNRFNCWNVDWSKNSKSRNGRV